jgi:hypothetical protein
MRICCAELGVGWVMLDCEWLLMRGDAKLTKPKTESDPLELLASRIICDTNYGKNILS